MLHDVPRTSVPQALTYLGCFSRTSHKIVILSEAPHRFYRVIHRLGAESKDPEVAYLVNAVRSFSTTQARELNPSCDTHLMVVGTPFHALDHLPSPSLCKIFEPWRVRQVRASVVERVPTA